MNTTAFNLLKTLCITLAILALLWVGYAWWVGDNLVLPWQVESTLKTRPFLLEYFQLNSKPSGVVADQIISWQKFTTGEMEYLLWPQYALLAIFMILLIVGSVASTYLNRFSYFVFSGLLIFAFIQLRLEELGVAHPYLTYGLIGGYLLLSYFFHAFKRQSSVLTRTLSMTLFYGTFLALIHWLPNMQYPGVVMLSFGITGPLLWAALFIVFIAGDNLFSLFKLTTQGAPKGKNGLMHFGIVGLIYLGLTGLLFAQKNEDIRFSLYLVEPLTLLLASMVSGYLCFDQKITTINVGGDIIVLKKWLYPLACALTLGLMAYAKINAIDSLQNALEWVIIISHLAFGSAFFIYALINFIPPLLQNIQVWHMFFQGPRTPMLTVRLFSIILVVGGFLYLEYRPYYQGKAGQYAMLACLAEKIDNKLLATQYYRQSVFFDFYNYRSNYALAQLATSALEKEEIPQHYSAIVRGRPNAKARVALGNYYAQNSDLYRSLSSLMYSPEIEQSPEARNNLGMAHYEYQNYDSAYKYFSSTRQNAAMVGEANLSALNYDVAALVDFDTTIQYEYIEDLHLKINRQALANAQNQYFPFDHELHPDTLLSRETLFYLYNAALAQKRPDAQKLIETITYYQSSPKNLAYNTFLQTALSFAYYHAGEVTKAFLSIDEVIASDYGAAAFPYYVKAIWAYDQGQANLTVECINNARKRGYNEQGLLDFMEDLKTVKNYDRAADFSQELKALVNNKAQLTDQEYIDSLIHLAGKNAFDTHSTLQTFDLLENEGAEAEKLYSLMVDNLKVNPNSAEFHEVYIYLCAKNRFRTFAETSFERLETLVSQEKLDTIRKEFERLLERNAPTLNQ